MENLWMGAHAVASPSGDSGPDEPPGLLSSRQIQPKGESEGEAEVLFSVFVCLLPVHSGFEVPSALRDG